MTSLGSFSAHGFNVTASSAVELIAGTQAAASGMVSSNVQEVGNLLHMDMSSLTRTVTAQGRQLASVNEGGFATVQKTLEGGFGTLETLSGMSIATQAIGFAVVATQLSGIRGELRDLSGKAAELVSLQRASNQQLESLVDFAQRQFRTQEQILATLISSRTVEAQQLIRQGWDNLQGGYVDEAFERFTRSLDYDNTVYVTHAELASIHEGRGQHEKAEDHFRRAERFVGVMGPPLSAFAAVQFAAFLDRQSRLEEARAMLLKALGAWRTPAWMFYLAELSADLGDEGGAFGALREAICGDAAYFASAMMSDRLSRLQPGLSRLLLAMDLERRTPVFEAIRRGGSALAQAEDLGANSGPLRHALQSMFERCCLSEYRWLDALRVEAERTANDAEVSLDQQTHLAAEFVKSAFEEYVAHVSRAPRGGDPDTPKTGVLRTASVLTIFAGLMSALMAFVLGNIAFSGSPDSAGGNDGGAPALICASITLFTFLGVALFLYTRADTINPEEVAAGNRSLANDWLTYVATATTLRQKFEIARGVFAQQLDKALWRGSPRVLSEARHWLNGLIPPSPADAPEWTRAGRASDSSH